MYWKASRLGARVQLDQVLASDDESVRNASSYLRHGQPGEGSGLWRSFLEQLESHEAADDQTQTVSGAVYAFTMFIRSFSQAANDLQLRTAPAAAAGHARQDISRRGLDRRTARTAR